MTSSQFLRNFYGFKGKELENHTVEELKAIAKNTGIRNYSRLKKDELVTLVASNKRYQRSTHAKTTKRKFPIGRAPDDIRVKDYRSSTERELDLDLVTIGERIKDKAKGIPNVDNDWYANELYSELDQYGKEGFPNLGEICFFSYSAAYPEDYPYYDKRPLVYVLSFQDDKIFGANLHYLSPSYRGALAGALVDKVGAVLPKKTYHSYFYTNISGMYTLPLDPREYADIAELITEDFVDKYDQKIELQSVWDSP